MERGHVFVVRGDLRCLHCDAIGYSGNPESQLSSMWRSALGAEAASWTEVKSWPVDAGRWVRRLSGTKGEPIPYVVPVAGRRDDEVSWYLDAVRVFLERATEDVRAEKPDHRPKIAMPLLGSGAGGQAWRRGGLLQQTLRMLWAYTTEHPVDVVLVLNTEAGFDAAQWFRSQEHEQHPWASLSDGMLEEADRLAALALAGEMALFLGAGVSMAAGLPGWKALLREAAAGQLTPEELAEAEFLPVLDQGQLLAGLVGEKALKETVASAIERHRRPSLAHVLLAALPVQEVVTTNYDTLFEKAAGCIGRGVNVIPYQGSATRQERWLMKLHGTIDKPDDIVLSRQTFLQYEASRAALAGLLAGLLMTRHVVFVGSSFSDDNVLRITEEVQRLGTVNTSEGPKRRSLGTNLAVGSSSVQRKLWEKEVHWVDLGKGAEGGRQLELVLDRVLASSTTSASYLFDASFHDSLSTEENSLREKFDALFELAQKIEHPAVSTLIQQLQQRLGRPLPPSKPKETP